MSSNHTNETPDSSTEHNPNNHSGKDNQTDTNVDIDLNEIDIDDKSYKVLTALNDAGGTSDTSEITQKTGLENHIINYRFGKLGTDKENNLGLLRTFKQTREEGGLTPPKGVELTERGRAAINAGLLDTHNPDPSLEERVEQLEAENTSLENQLDAVLEDLVMLRSGFKMVEAALENSVFADGEELTDYMPQNFDASKSDYLPDSDGDDS